MQQKAESDFNNTILNTPCGVDNASGNSIASSRNCLVRILPEWLKRRIRYGKTLLTLFCGAFYDFRRCCRYSGILTAMSQKSSHAALLTLHYHIIEKGLSLAAPRPGFGRPVVNSLIDELDSYVGTYGPDRVAVITLDVLCAYRDFNRKNGIHDENLDQRLLVLTKNISALPDSETSGGVLQVRQEEILDSCKAGFKKLAMTRYSVRTFTGEPVSRELIEEAVSVSIKTPSVCNRQPWRVHYYFEPEDRARVLAQQSGNRGFGNAAGAILIVTADIGVFLSSTERNEPFVDGGMFAMSLVYALHSLGLGTCCLHLCLGVKDDRAFHRIAGIDESEVFIMMLAVGKLHDNFRVAKSCRKPLSEVLVTHSGGTQNIG